MTDPEFVPLHHTFPILAEIRLVEDWRGLAAFLERRSMDSEDLDPALEALVALDRSWGDEPSAETHEALRETIARAREVGVESAFRDHSAARIRRLPAAVVTRVERMDDAYSSFLRDPDDRFLQAAEEAWTDLTESGDVDSLSTEIRVSLLCDATLIHLERFHQTTDEDQLDFLITISHKAMALFRNFEGHPPACGLCLDPRVQSVSARLGRALRTRYALHSDPRDLQLSTHLASSGLQMTNPASPDYPLRLTTWGILTGFGGIEALEDGTAAFLQAVAAELPGSPMRIEALIMAARGRLAQHLGTREPGPLEEAIDLLRRAIRESTGDAEKARLQLARGLILRAALTGDESDVPEAVQYVRDFFSLTDVESSPNRPAVQQLLAVIEAILPAPAAADTVDAIIDALARLARGVGSGEVAERLSVEAGMLRIHAELRRDPNHLKNVIRLFEIALSIDPESKRTAARWNDLAIAYAMRFERYGSNKDLGQGILAAHRAVDASSEGSLDEKLYANGVGRLMMMRFEVLGDTTDLQQAIQVFEFAVKLSSDERRAVDPNRLVGMTGNLGSAMLSRFELDGRTQDLERAFALLEEAEAAAEHTGSEVKSRALNNLASAFHVRWRKHHDKRDLDEAISRWQRVVSEAADEAWPVPLYNLANALLSRYEDCKTESDLRDSHEMLLDVVARLDEHSPDRALAEGRLAHACHLIGDSAGATNWSRVAVERAAVRMPETQLRVAWDWGGRAASDGAWAEAAEAYAYTLSAMRRLFDANLLRHDRESWLESAYGVPTHACHARARAGDARGAVEALESGRGLLLGEQLGTVEEHVEAALRGREPALYEIYRAALEARRALATRVESAGSADSAGTRVTYGQVETTQNQLLKAVYDLKSAPGLEDLFAPPTYDAIRESAVVPVVYFVAGPDAGLALLVDRDAPAPEPIWIDAFDEKSIGARAREFLRAYERLDVDPEGWTTSLEDLTAWLGGALAPSLAALDGRRAVFIPTGALSYFPLHAAWVEDPNTPTGRCYAFDRSVITYAPTALSFHAAARRPSASEPAKEFLAVSSPSPSVEPPLPFASVEAAYAARFFDETHSLDGEFARDDNVRLALPNCQVAHFACHARSVIEQPRSSAITLAYDQRLTVWDLTGMDLKRVKLALLSACETGVPGRLALDEVIGIGAALFGSGVDGVISSLWPVLGESSLMLTTRFYEIWRGADGPPVDPAESLIRAQQWLRDTTNEAKRQHWDAMLAAGRMPESTHRALCSQVADLDPEARDYASPDDWAPFTFMGRW
jgi:CHAT domain-containing protein